MTQTAQRSFFLTGCASGIAKCLAKRLLDDGHRVFCTDIDHEATQEWLDECDFDVDQYGCRRLDVRKIRDWEAAMDEAVHKFGSIDVLMNVAGYLKPGYVDNINSKDIDMHLDCNVKGVMLGTRAAAHQMVEQGQGHIINFGSLASLSPVPGLSLYAASKFAVRGFSLSVAEELRDKGVDVSLVMLDAVKTPMLDLQADYEEAALTFSGPRPLTLDEVESLIIDKVLPKRPLESTLPKSRGLMAKVASAAPAVTKLLSPLLTRLGKKAQSKYEE